MGGRGAGSGLSNGSGANIQVLNETDVWTYRHNQDNEPFVDAINESVRRIQEDFPGVMDHVEHVNSAELGGMDRDFVLGYYSQGERTVALNQNYTDIAKMNRMYDAAIASGYHPPRGDRSGTEAVALHEMGHALNDHIAQQMGVDLDTAARRIVQAAYTASKGTGGTKAWAGGISGYAQESWAECVAEASADYYCNGRNARPQSLAIMEQMRRYAARGRRR